LVFGGGCNEHVCSDGLIRACYSCTIPTSCPLACPSRGHSCGRATRWRGSSLNASTPQRLCEGARGGIVAQANEELWGHAQSISASVSVHAHGTKNKAANMCRASCSPARQSSCFLHCNFAVSVLVLATPHISVACRETHRTLQVLTSRRINAGGPAPPGATAAARVAAAAGPWPPHLQRCRSHHTTTPHHTTPHTTPHPCPHTTRPPIKLIVDRILLISAVAVVDGAVVDAAMDSGLPPMAQWEGRFDSRWFKVIISHTTCMYH